MSNQAQGKVDMGGHLNKVKEDQVQMDPKADADQFHIRNIGKLVEQNEADIRHEMQGVYLNKSKQIINTGRLQEAYMSKDERNNFQQELFAMIKQNAEKNQ